LTTFPNRNPIETRAVFYSKNPKSRGFPEHRSSAPVTVVEPVTVFEPVTDVLNSPRLMNVGWGDIEMTRLDREGLEETFATGPH